MKLMFLNRYRLGVSSIYLRNGNYVVYFGFPGNRGFVSQADMLYDSHHSHFEGAIDRVVEMRGIVDVFYQSIHLHKGKGDDNGRVGTKAASCGGGRANNLA